MKTSLKKYLKRVLLRIYSILRLFGFDPIYLIKSLSCLNFYFRDFYILKKQKGLDKKYPFIQEGEKLKFTYLKQPNPFKDSVLSFPQRLPKEFDMQMYIDYDTQFDKSFVEPIKVILDCMGWSTEKKNSLESFFG